MARTSPPTEIVMNVTDTKQQFSKVINQVARGEARVVVEKSGAPVAAIISQQELRDYERLREQEARRRDELHSSLTEFSRQFDDVTDEELERVLAEAHREYREITDREHGRR
jgi:prevent-host-death family protein